jgi:Asp-tRNA(Asn)/Glu-tRNA(Gln) amidotransferase A subunit family amidase
MKCARRTSPDFWNHAMTDILGLSVRALALQVAQRTLSAEAVTRAYIERIDAQEAALHAWQYFDAELALGQARRLDAAGGASGPLAGVPVGVKDVMDTADMPSGYGSPIYATHRPVTDAAAVAAVRAAGGIVMGKTVTTEFATFKPGPTVNPRSPSLSEPHTPGGSSSGSAAAVAAAMVPVAFGTQTAASIVRPASFCGIVGYKPTFGTLPTAGIKPLSPSLDTLGVLTRRVDDAALFVGILAHREFVMDDAGPLRVGVCSTPYWDVASPASRQANAFACLKHRAKHTRIGANRQRTFVASEPAGKDYEAPRSVDFGKRLGVPCGSSTGFTR